MGLASARLWAVCMALGLMSCVVTDQVDFEVVPPNVTATNPPPVVNRPSVGTETCPGGMEFFYREFNAQSQKGLERKVAVDGRVIDETSGSGRFCVPFGKIGGLDIDGNPTDPGCYKVEIFVSHGFRRNYQEITNPADPIVPGDIDDAKWIVGVADPNAPSCAEAPDDPDCFDLWEQCVAVAQPPVNTEPVSNSQQIEGGARP